MATIDSAGVVVDVSMAARLVMALVFLLAAGTKVLDRSGARQFLVSLGLGATTATWASWAVIAVEVAVAALLVAAPAPVGGAAAAVVFTAFVLAIWRAHHRGAGAPCGCFGTAASPQRNLWLQLLPRGGGIVAGLAIVATADAANSSPSSLTLVLASGGALVVLLWWGDGALGRRRGGPLSGLVPAGSSPGGEAGLATHTVSRRAVLVGAAGATAVVFGPLARAFACSNIVEDLQRCINGGQSSSAMAAGEDRTSCLRGCSEQRVTSEVEALDQHDTCAEEVLSDDGRLRECAEALRNKLNLCEVNYLACTPTC